MATDPKDPGTLDLLPAPKRRGPKPSGKALSAAERQRAYRARQALRIAELEAEVASLRSLLDS